MKEAVPKGTVPTDLNEICRASIDGRGELLIVHPDFLQPVVMKDERTFVLFEDVTIQDATNDLTGTITW